MITTWQSIQRIYLTLLLLHTLAASLIWGINTLLLLDAGLNNAQAFAANAFFTAGFVLFEIPTGVIADTRGRRMSYLLGTVTLTISTLLYLLMLSDVLCLQRSDPGTGTSFYLAGETDGIGIDHRLQRQWPLIRPFEKA